MTEAAVREAFAKQAGWCRQLGSPFTALLCESLRDRLDRTTATGARVLDWSGDAVMDALPLRLTGALHALVRRGRLPATCGGASRISRLRMNSACQASSV